MTHTTKRLVAAAAIALTLVAGACGDDDSVDESADSPDTSTTSTSIDADLPSGDEPRTDIDLVCAAGPFRPDALESPDGLPDGVETEDGPAADALRDLLANVEATTGRDVPDRSWRELSVLETDELTLYEYANGSPPDLWVATVQQLGDGDRWQGELVEPCTPAPWIEGMFIGYWWLDDDADLDADTTEVSVLVQEDSCDSGRGPDGRVGEPVITYGADVVVVTYPVAPRDDGDVFTCQAHPPAEVALELDEPLGDRELLDGSTWPAHEPSANTPPHVGPTRMDGETAEQ